jgi:hypothetical protein
VKNHENPILQEQRAYLYGSLIKALHDQAQPIQSVVTWASKLTDESIRQMISSAFKECIVKWTYLDDLYKKLQKRQ